MTVEAAILKNVERLPDEVKQAVLLYTEFLANQYPQVKAEERLEAPCLAGSMKGTFVLPLPDDFDLPLKEFE
jgi:beta-lactamase regulating signal transducer with metallopeptidase domain